jgi:uncharacterized protein (DUF4415 family)
LRQTIEQRKCQPGSDPATNVTLKLDADVLREARA